MERQLIDVNTEIRKYFESQNIDTNTIELMISFLNENAFSFVYNFMDLSLNDMDIRAIEAIVTEEGYDEMQKVDLYKDYFEDKTKLNIYTMIVEFVEDMFNIIKTEVEFIRKLIDMVAQKAQGEEAIKELEIYLDQILEKTEREYKLKLESTID